MSLSQLSTADVEQLREEKNILDNYKPDGQVADITPGAYYLESNDAKHRRTYQIAPLA